MLKRLLATFGLASMTCSALADEPWWPDAISLLLKENKRTIVEAKFTGPASLWVSVRDDGSRRDGFAQYVCVEIMGAGMEPGDFYVVHIWDAAQLARGRMVELGRSECSKPK